jgi:hypothetical protein
MDGWMDGWMDESKIVLARSFTRGIPILKESIRKSLFRCRCVSVDTRNASLHSRSGSLEFVF